MGTMQALVLVVIFVVAGIAGIYIGSRKKDAREDALKVWKSQLKLKRPKWDKDDG